MATNAQRSGTRNLTVNLPVEYIAELGRAAFKKFDSRRSALVTDLIERGAAAHDPALAVRLKEIRRQFYGVALVLIFCGTLFGHQELRRPGRIFRRDGEAQCLEF